MRNLPTDKCTMHMTLALVCVALALQSPVIFQPAEAVSHNPEKGHVIASHNAVTDPCININDSSKKKEKDTADKICGQAFLTLDQNNANSCRGWRHPECRLLSGFSYRQCSCIISISNQSGIHDETRSFRGCALDLWTDRYFTGQAVAPSGFKDLFKSVERNALAARIRSSFNSFNAGGLSGAGTSYTPNKAQGGKVPVRAASQNDAGTSTGEVVHTPGSNILTCDVCHHEYKSFAALRDHSKSHRQLLACNLCKRTYSSGTNVKKHIKLKHKGQEAAASRKDPNLGMEIMKAYDTKNASKKFVCPECGARYSWARSLSSHMKRHDEQATYCTFCQRYLSTKSNYNSHMRLKHQEPAKQKPSEKE